MWAGRHLPHRHSEPGLGIERAEGVATDSAGDVYFTSLNCVFKLDRNGVVTRIAGTSRPGYSGDGAPGTDAELNFPAGVAVDGAGNLFIADYGNKRIRKVSPDGLIITVAGGGSADPGDGGPATSAQLGGLQLVEYIKSLGQRPEMPVGATPAPPANTNRPSRVETL